MDDRTAYQILKIMPGTSIQEISVKYEHFVKLYKLYLTGQELNISPDELEQMRAAYICLLYKRIDDSELPNLYPQESNGLCHQVCKKIVEPFCLKHKAKIIYTIIMSVLTYLIIMIMRYKPVDLNITIFIPPCDSNIEYQIRGLSGYALESEIPQSIAKIDRPSVDFQEYTMVGASYGLFVSGETDLYIMKEELFDELTRNGVEFLPLNRLISDKETYANNSLLPSDDQTAKAVLLSKDSIIYKKICGLKGENEPWVAAVSINIKNREEALTFLKSIGTALKK